MRFDNILLSFFSSSGPSINNKDIHRIVSQLRKFLESLSLRAQQMNAIHIALAEQPHERVVQTALWT